MRGRCFTDLILRVLHKAVRQCGCGGESVRELAVLHEGPRRQEGLAAEGAGEGALAAMAARMCLRAA